MSVFIDYIDAISDTVDNSTDIKPDQQAALGRLLRIIDRKFGRDWTINALNNPDAIGDSAKVVQQIHVEVERGQNNRSS